MFKRYDGIINSVPQKAIDSKLPICPFCGRPAHWLLKINTGFSSSTIEFMCEKCHARLSQENVGSFYLDILQVVDSGIANLANLQLNGAYSISALSSVAKNLQDNLSAENKISQIENEEGETKKEAKEGSNEILERKIYNGPSVAAASPPNNRTAKVLISLISIIIIVFTFAYIIFAIVSCETSGALTYDNYLKIHNGMTYSQVAEIFDSPGQLDVSSSFEGYTLEYYTWQNASGTKIVTVGFENGRVCTKAQIGLT